MNKALIAALAFAILTSGCATPDTSSPEARKRVSTTTAIPFYARGYQPKQYKSLGVVVASSRSESSRPKNMTRAMDDLRKEAVRRGANALILIDSDQPTGGASAQGNDVNVMGEAILVEL